MSCEGCISSASGQVMELEKVITEAKAYAQEQNKSMAIYKEGNEYHYCDAFFAYSNGFLVVQVASFHSNMPVK